MLGGQFKASIKDTRTKSLWDHLTSIMFPITTFITLFFNFFLAIEPFFFYFFIPQCIKPKIPNSNLHVQYIYMVDFHSYCVLSNLTLIKWSVRAWMRQFNTNRSIKASGLMSFSIGVEWWPIIYVNYFLACTLLTWLNQNQKAESQKSVYIYTSHERSIYIVLYIINNQSLPNSKELGCFHDNKHFPLTSGS